MATTLPRRFTLRSLWVLAAASALLLAPAAPQAKRDRTPEHRGTLSSRPEGKEGTWVVGGRSFKAVSSTQLDTDEGPLTPGACVKVRFVSGSDGDVADEIDSEPASDCTGGSGSSRVNETPK